MNDDILPSRVGRVCALAVAMLAIVVWFTTRNDPRLLSLARNTLLLAGGTVLFSLPLGTLLAILLSRTDLPGRQLATAAIGLGLFVPLYAQAGAWMAGFGLQGWYTLASGRDPWISGMPGAIWIHAAAAIPWVVLIVGIGLRWVEPDLEEQGLLDASPADVLWKVTLPQASAALVGAAIWTLLAAAGEMTVTDLLVVRTYAEEIYTQASATGEPLGVPFQIGQGLSLSALLAGAALAGVSMLAPRGIRTPNRPRVVFRLGAARWLWAGFVAGILFCVVGLPLANVLYKAGLITTDGPDGFERSWSLTKVLRLTAGALVRSDAGGWRAGRVLHEIGWTLLVGGLAATLAVMLAAPLAWMARRGGVRAGPAWLAAGCGLALPGTVVGIGLAWLFNVPVMLWLYQRAGFDLYGQSILAPVLAQALRGMPLALLILWHAFQSVPESTVDAARLEGAGPFARLMFLGLGARRTAVLTAWLVALAIATGELSASLMVAPARVQLLTRWIYNQLHTGQEDYVASVLLVVFAGYGMLAGVCAWISRRKE